MAVSRYRSKRAVLAPYAAYKRRQSRDLDQVTRSILEMQYYRPTIYRFMRATAANPNILVEADLDSSSVVLDVGAYIGEWCEKISERYGSTIYAFEPNPNAVRRLTERVGDHDNVSVLGFGLGGADAPITLALDGPGSNAFATSGAFGTVEAEVRDVAGVLDELGFDAVDLCKVNIEGGEYDLFDRLIETGWLERIRTLSIQFHEWHPKAYNRRRAIRRAFSHTHYEVWNYPFVWELWRRRGEPLHRAKRGNGSLLGDEGAPDR
jgi:FkbM family methyltransferase